METERLKVDTKLKFNKTRQSHQCGFFLFILNSNKSKSMVRVFRVLFRVENMVWSCLACARKLARKILILNILDYIGPLMIHMAYMP